MLQEIISSTKDWEKKKKLEEAIKMYQNFWSLKLINLLMACSSIKYFSSLVLLQSTYL